MRKILTVAEVIADPRTGPELASAIKRARQLPEEIAFGPEPDKRLVSQLGQQAGMWGEEYARRLLFPGWEIPAEWTEEAQRAFARFLEEGRTYWERDRMIWEQIKALETQIGRKRAEATQGGERLRALGLSTEELVQIVAEEISPGPVFSRLNIPKRTEKLRVLTQALSCALEARELSNAFSSREGGLRSGLSTFGTRIGAEISAGCFFRAWLIQAWEAMPEDW